MQLENETELVSYLSPILLFTYKKLPPLKRTVEALKNNLLADKSVLYIFSDGPKEAKDVKQISEVREYLKEIEGFKKIIIKTEEKNKGLAPSIIDGVSEILNTHESVIVLEDDLLTSPNFLSFMNQGLAMYRSNPKIISISGYTFPITITDDYDFDNYFTLRASSWGWATWKDRWAEVDWEVADYDTFSLNKAAQKRFNSMGSDMSAMLAKQMNGKISSWAIRWCYHQFKLDLYSVYPTISKVANIGFGEAATHTKGNKERYATILDVSRNKYFVFNPKPALDERFIKPFVARFSLKTRIYYKVLDLLGI